MSLKRTLIAALLAVAVSACGFRPMYGGSGSDSVNADLSEIKINLIADRSGQQLRNFLLDRLTPKGQPKQPAYTLAIQLEEETSSIAVERSGLPTRANLRVTANYILREAGSYDQLLSGRARVFSSYNLLDADFSTLTSEQDAETRALEAIADQIQTRLATYFIARQPVAETPADG